MRHGHVCSAVPDHHYLLLVDDVMALSKGPTENGHRLAVDAASVAEAANAADILRQFIRDDVLTDEGPVP